LKEYAAEKAEMEQKLKLKDTAIKSKDS